MHCMQYQKDKEIVCIGKLPRQKKLITWSGSDEGEIALLSLFFLLYKKLYQEVANWEVAQHNIMDWKVKLGQIAWGRSPEK